MVHGHDCEMCSERNTAHRLAGSRRIATQQFAPSPTLCALYEGLAGAVPLPNGVSVLLASQLTAYVGVALDRSGHLV